MSLAFPSAQRQQAVPESRTDVVIKRVSDPVLRDTLIDFEANLSPVAPPTDHVRSRSSWPLDAVVIALSHDAGVSHRGTGSGWVITGKRQAVTRPVSEALTAIDEVRDVLGIALRDVLCAADVKKRTYHSWKAGKVSRIRPGSLGKLWSLHRLVTDLEEIKGRNGVRYWFSQDKDRITDLVRGNLDELMEAASRTPVEQERTPAWLGAALAEDSPDNTSPTLRGITMEADDVVEPG